MKRNNTLGLFLAICLAAAACGGGKESDLAAGFVSPPPSARPWVYWFWLDGNITRQGITADLEAMKRVGIGGVLIMEVDQGAPKGPARFGSPEWRELFKFVLSEANHLGLEVNMSNDAGWCGSGGSWITPALSQKKLVWTETIVEGGKPFGGQLSAPPPVAGWYRDIAVLAFPTPAGDDVKMAASTPKATASFGGRVFEARAATDGNPETRLTLPLPETDKPAILQLEFAHPYLVRTLSLSLEGPEGAGVHASLQASDDGRAFKIIREFDAAPPSFSLDFNEVSAPFFRVAFTQADPALKILSVAEIELLSRFRIDNIQAKAAFVPAHVALPPQHAAQPLPAGLIIPRDQVLDLSARMDKDGRLAWDVPAGSWTVLRLGYTPTGKENHPAPLEGRGLECDKLNVQGAEAMFAGLMAKLAADSPSLVTKTLVSTHIDSWEVGSQNWTEGFREEFEKRRGYDLLRFLPAITGRVVDGLEISERFLWDLRQTISEMVVENYAGRFRDLAHKAGMRLSIEAYDAPCDDMTYAGQADEPMGEFWSWRKYAGASWTTEMTSAAHVYGKKIVGAEAFTANDGERWRGHPAEVKDLGDWAFCEGINRFVVHRYALQPWLDRAPGMSMGPWGLHYERTQTWWEMSKAWHEYLSRCQFLLQQGLFMADILCLEPEGQPMSFFPPAGVRPDALERGPYNFDGCTPEVVMTRLTVEDGRLVLPDGMSYRILALPETDAMTPALLRKVRELVLAGATVLGAPPKRAPGLTGYPACDNEIKTLAGEMWAGMDGRDVTEHRLGKGRVIYGKTPARVLAEMGVGRDFSYTGEPGVTLRYTHRTIVDAEVYFVANKSQVAGQALCSFRVAGRRPELWYPDTGQVVKTAAYDEDEGRVSVPIRFDPLGSLFVVFRSGQAAERNRVVSILRDGQTAAGAVSAFNVTDLPEPLELNGPWDVTFDPKLGAPERLTMETLVSWSDHPDPAIKYYSGPAVYRNTIRIPEGMIEANRRHFLDLGKVAVMAEVKLNGHDLGILWKAPFRVDATDTLKVGDNPLEVKVVNLWINRQIGDEQLPEDSDRNPDGTLKAWPKWLLDGRPSPTGRVAFTSWRLWKRGDPLVESGLLGPVVLRTSARISSGVARGGSGLPRSGS